jgi:hypothetical protein
MKVTLGTFACAGIEAHLGADLHTAVHTALDRYTHGLRSGRAPVELPGFCLDRAGPCDDVAIELCVDGEARELLEREAERQGATLSQLANHSVLSYLAELDLVETVPLRGASDALPSAG